MEENNNKTGNTLFPQALLFHGNLLPAAVLAGLGFVYKSAALAAGAGCLIAQINISPFLGLKKTMHGFLWAAFGLLFILMAGILIQTASAWLQPVAVADLLSRTPPYATSPPFVVLVITLLCIAVKFWISEYVKNAAGYGEKELSPYPLSWIFLGIAGSRYLGLAAADASVGILLMGFCIFVQVRYSLSLKVRARGDG